MIQSDQSYYLIPYVTSTGNLAIEIITHENASAEKFEEIKENLSEEFGQDSVLVGNPDFTEVTEIHPIFGVQRHELHQILEKFGKVIPE